MVSRVFDHMVRFFFHVWTPVLTNIETTATIRNRSSLSCSRVVRVPSLHNGSNKTQLSSQCSYSVMSCGSSSTDTHCPRDDGVVFRLSHAQSTRRLSPRAVLRHSPVHHHHSTICFLCEKVRVVSKLNTFRMALLRALHLNRRQAAGGRRLMLELRHTSETSWPRSHRVLRAGRGPHETDTFGSEADTSRRTLC